MVHPDSCFFSISDVSEVCSEGEVEMNPNKLPTLHKIIISIIGLVLIVVLFWDYFK